MRSEVILPVTVSILTLTTPLLISDFDTELEVGTEQLCFGKIKNTNQLTH